MPRNTKSASVRQRGEQGGVNGDQEQGAGHAGGEVIDNVAVGADDLTDASWLPIAEAALAAGVPSRTAHNWARSGKLPTRRVAGVRTIPLGTLRRLARERAGDDPVPASPAPAAAAARVAERDLDGDQAAVLFAEFEHGETPLGLVQRLRLPPRVARNAWKEFTSLRDAARDVRADRLAAAEDAVARLGAAVFEQLLPEHVADLRHAVAQLQETIAALPVPTRAAFTCPTCSTIGCVEAFVRCSSCGESTRWGFQPDRG